MKILKFLYHPDFRKAIKSCPPKERLKIIKKINLFLTDPFSPSLKTHKLSGKLKDYWSFSLTYQERVMFRFRSKGTVEFIDIGGHEIYK